MNADRGDSGGVVGRSPVVYVDWREKVGKSGPVFVQRELGGVGR